MSESIVTGLTYDYGYSGMNWRMEGIGFIGGGDIVGKDLGLALQFTDPGNVIIKCAHCHQWGARKCACKHCGAPMPE
jgi:hypothetical protein